VFFEKVFKAGPRGVELHLGLYELLLSGEHIGETPSHFRIAARADRQQ
jgi:hypothetical protein